MFKGKKPIAKAPTTLIVSPEDKRTIKEWKAMDDAYKKTEHFKMKKKK